MSAIRLAGFARRSTPERPYAVVNDYVSLGVGLRMGAPVPPAALVNLGDQVGVVTMAFGEGAVRPPPTDFEELASTFPRQAAAVLVLDFLVLNTDRHEDNTGHLPRVGVAAWDFDAALFGHRPPVSGVENLELGKDKPVSRHPLAAFLSNDRDIAHWVEAARHVPRDGIRRLVSECFEARLLTAGERDQLVEFISSRQSVLGDLILGRLDEDFPLMTQRPLKM